MINNFKDFHMPRYDEIPDIDLYMDQLLVYIDKVLLPFSTTHQEKFLTTSMVNNYVKQGLLPPTVKKRYAREHVARLIEICIAKQVHSITEISRLLDVQNALFDIETAYNYICTELENVLKSTFSNEPLPEDSAISTQDARLLVRHTTIAFAYKLYIHQLCDALYEQHVDKNN